MERKFCDECKVILKEFMKRIEDMKKSHVKNQENISAAFTLAAERIAEIKDTVADEVYNLDKHIKILYMILAMNGIVQLFNLFKR